MDRDRLITLFRRWSAIEAVANLSPLYALFGNAVADDEGLLDLANECLPGQPPPNILFAAVHAALANRPEEPLAAYYATLGGTRPADPEATAMFRDFCRHQREVLLPVIRTRLTQTNEVRRSALLLPAFAEAADDSGKRLTLIEIGASAGLNLNFDRYRYRYGPVELGDPESPLLLESEPKRAPPRVAMPVVESRCGIDLNPLDVRSPEDVGWLRALLWPEHTDRLALMNAAIQVAKEHPPVLYGGDVLALLPELVDSASPGAVPCIFATFVLNQFTPEMRTRLRDQLLELSHARPIYMVVIGFTGFVEPNSQLAGEEQVWLLRLRGGAGEYRVSSIANPHGRWIDWQPGSPWKPWVASD